MAEQDVAPEGIKVGWEPNRDKLRELYERPGPVSLDEFRSAMSKTWDEPRGDAIDGILNSLNILTPGVVRGRKRYDESQVIDPLYKNFLSVKLGSALAPTQEEAANRFGLTPSTAPQSMMPGPRVTTPGNLDEVIGGNYPAVGDPQVRPGLQPEGIPQQAGLFGLPQPYLPGPFTNTPLTPQLQLPTNDPGPMTPNMQASLRPIDQGIVAARTQAMSHPRAAAVVPAGIQEHARMVQAEIAAQIEENGGKPLSARALADIELQVGKVFTPEARKGTPTYRKTSAEASIQETEQTKRAELLDSTIAEKKSRATWETRQALDAAGMFQSKLKHLQSQTDLNNANAGRLGQTVFNQAAMIELQRASKTLDGIKAAWAMGNVDEQGLMALIKSYLEATQKQLQLQGVPPNAIFELLGFPATQMTTSPQGGQGIPTPVPGTPSGVTPNPPQPLPQTQPGPTKNTAEEELKALEKANPGFEYQRKADGTLQRRKKS